jgi:hypothetical protein
LRQRIDQFQALDCEVVAVSFEPLPLLQEFARREKLPLPVSSDPERKAYRAFGLQEGSAHRLFGLPTIWTYLRGLFQGRWPRLPSANIRQLGGDILIDASGKVALLHRSHSPADRPTVGMLLETVRKSIKESHDGDGCARPIK